MTEDNLPFNQECQICQELINIEDQIQRCQNPDYDHIFHHHCAQSWIIRGSNTCPTCRYVLSNEPPSLYPIVNRHFSEFVPNYDYLLTRSWYLNDPSLKILLEKVVSYGFGNRIDTMNNDFRYQLLDFYFEKNILNYYYLQERSWFNNNYKIKILLEKVIDLGLQDLVEVTFPGNFNTYLEQLITYNGGNLKYELNKEILFQIYPDMQDINEFRLSHYGFSSIHYDTFQDLPNSTILKYIYLDENFIEFIQTGTFNNLPNLEYIDLSYNKVYSIFTGYFPDLPRLQINLSNNNFI